MTTRTAKVAMLAEMPESRISGQPTTSASSAAASAAGERAGKVGHSARGDQRRQVGQEDGLRRGLHGEQRRDVGADRHEGDVAEGEHAGIADEDVEADHGDEIDQRLRRPALQHGRRERGDERHGDDTIATSGDERPKPAAAARDRRIRSAPSGRAPG